MCMKPAYVRRPLYANYNTRHDLCLVACTALFAAVFDFIDCIGGTSSLQFSTSCTSMSNSSRSAGSIVYANTQMLTTVMRHDRCLRN